MAKYHISPTTGRPNLCRAERRPCPIGGEHYDSKEAAQAGQEAKLQAEHEVFTARKKRSDEAGAVLARLLPEDRAAAAEWAERYAGKGEHTMMVVEQGVRANLASLRSLADELGGQVMVLNGGAYQRFKADGAQWTMELQTDGEGTTHVRIFNAGVPVYGDHSRDRAWTFSRRNVARHAETVAKLYKDFISEEKNKAPEPMWG